MKNPYESIQIRYNVINLKGWIEEAEEKSTEKQARSYAVSRVSPYATLSVSPFFDYFPHPSMFALERVEERLRWMKHLPLGDYYKMVDTDNKEILNKFLPALMSELRVIINGYWPEEVKVHLNGIGEALNAYQADFKRSAVTLMIRENEGLVWELARQIAEKEPNITFDKYQRTFSTPDYTKKLTSLSML